MRKIYLIILVVLLLSTGCMKKEVVKGVTSSVNKDGDVQRVKVISQNANIRSGCSTNANVIEKANQNDRYEVLSKVANWYAVQLPDNSIGFIPEKQVQAVINPTASAAPTEGTDPGTAPSETTIPNTKDSPTTPKVTNTPAPNKTVTPTKTATPTKTTPAADNAPKENTNTTASGLTANEQEMLTLINQARGENNLPALKADLEMTKVARIKAKDMIDNNYFSHNSPTYGSPFDMMKNFNIQYVRAGENIAGNQTVQAAHEALMNSPGHRANILSSDFTHIGIGIQEGGSYGMMFCQLFASKPE